MHEKSPHVFFSTVYRMERFNWCYFGSFCPSTFGEKEFSLKKNGEKALVVKKAKVGSRTIVEVTFLVLNTHGVFLKKGVHQLQIN